MENKKKKPTKAVKEAEKRVRNVTRSVQEKVKAATSRTKPKERPNRSKLLVSIVNARDDARLKEILDECSVALSFTFSGTGTARSQLLDYLGIGETEKAVVFSLFPESDEDIIIREIRAKMSLYLVGRGISFTVPLSGCSEITANGLATAAANKNFDGRKVMKSADRKFDLIIASVGANFVDDAIEAAREAGAAGGTVIRARSIDNKKAEQFIGISIMAERELLLVLTKKEGTMAIMEALSEKVGLKTEAGGIIFSLPVDRTAGISAADEEAFEQNSAETKEEKKVDDK